MNMYDNINLGLGAQNTRPARELMNMIDGFKGQAFAIIFMPGAGAPITNLDNWMAAGLGGCTGESIKLCDQNGKFNYIIINSMNRKEQEAAHANILKSKGVDLSKQNTINDPGCTLRQVFAVDANMTKTVDGRMAYIPRAYIFRADGTLCDYYENQPAETGKARAADKHVEKIATDVMNLQGSSYTRSFSKPENLNKFYDDINALRDVSSQFKRTI